MSNHLNKSIRLNILFKYVNLALTVASGILLIPFYLKFFPIKEYGAWVAVGSFATWFAAIDPGIANLLIQKVAHSRASNNQQALLGYIAAGVTCSFGVAVIVLVFGIFLSHTFIAWLEIKNISRELLLLAFRIAIANTSFMIITYALIGIIQGLHNSLSAGLLATLRSIMKIAGVIILLESGYGLLALPIAELGASAIVLAATLARLIVILRREEGNFRPSFDRLGEFLRLFTYSFGARFGKILAGSIDKVLIARFIGVEQVAAYSLTATLPRQAENLINQPIAAFRPPLAHLAGEASHENLSRYIERLLRWVIWGGGWVFACLLSLNADFVKLWVGSDGFAGANIALALAFLFWVRVWTNSTGAIGFSLGDIRRNSLAEWAYSILLVPALILGAIFWGLSGIVFAHIATQLFCMAWYFPWSIWIRLQWSMENFTGLVMQFFLTGLAVVIAYWVHPSAENWKDLLIASLLVTVTYFIILVIASKVFRCEVNSLRSSQDSA